MRFDWDAAKAKANLRKHGISFEEALTVFGDRGATTHPDLGHSRTEDREVTIGMSERGRVLIVVHVRRADQIRLISARRPTRRERSEYEEDLKQGPWA